MIHIQDLTYTYPTSETPALNGINLHVPEGQLCAVIGANGASKSTSPCTRHPCFRHDIPAPTHRMNGSS